MKIELPAPSLSQPSSTSPTHTVTLIGNPLKMSKCQTLSPLPPPLLGQHTEEVLAALGGKKKIKSDESE